MINDKEKDESCYTFVIFLLFFVYLHPSIIKNHYNILIFKYLYVILHHGCVKLVTRIQ